MAIDLLEGVRFQHPLYDRDSIGVLGDYVTLEARTGAVHTPPGHGTLGVTLRDLEKLSLRGRVSKRVQQCDRVIERSLHRRRARNREDNLTELFRRRMLVLAKTKRQIKEAVHPRE